MNLNERTQIHRYVTLQHQQIHSQIHIHLLSELEQYLTYMTKNIFSLKIQPHLYTLHAGGSNPSCEGIRNEK